MDMQKERAKFESVFPCSVGTTLNEYGHYESKINQQDAMIQNISWEVWQAAKASAVPDGYVVVPKEPTAKQNREGVKKFVKHRNNNTWACDAIDDIYKAMIEAAQEQNQ